jgi:hypothetical protein
MDRGVPTEEVLAEMRGRIVTADLILTRVAGLNLARQFGG